MGQWKLVYIPSKEEAYEQTRKMLLPWISKNIKKGNMVWCRNAEVCSLATPCKDLKCKYKKTREDIVQGAAKCQKFQMTEFSSSWDYAKHVDYEKVR